jgi:hypothetical protein
VLRVDADPTLIGYEFAQAGGSPRGLSQNALWSYWQKYGIAGVYLKGIHSFYPNATDVENGVRDYGAMIATLRFGEGWYFGRYKVTAGGHAVVVMGYTPEGPLVVSWGQVIQMTWKQWNDEVVGMWGIAAS